MTTPSLPCANCPPDGVGCQKVGKSSCGNCRLVVYCGLECQKAHWPIHKLDCKSPLSKETWTPNWILTNRIPAFIGNMPTITFGGKKYLWGNVPALDVLQLGSNEGDNYQGQLNLLFAASGDLRNVVKTVVGLPSTYGQTINIVMNDRDLDVVARNAIMLLLALTAEGQDEVIDCIIHVWYSAFLRKSDVDIINQKVRPLLKEVCDKIKGQPPNTYLGKTWVFGHQRSLRLVLEKSSWEGLLALIDVPKGLTADKANIIRTAVTLADSRVDYRDRAYLFFPPAHRVARHRFREDGLLLPFGTCRTEFRLPNPTFFQNKDNWPMRDNSDPLSGWSIKEIEATSIGPATSDIYGKLFRHVKCLLKAFVERLSSSSMTFKLLQVDASDLPSHQLERSFDRIEVSNISDSAYLGIHKTVAIMSPLLQPSSVNPHATLITLFMNMVDCNKTMGDKVNESASILALLEFLQLRHLPVNNRDPEFVKIMYARDRVQNYDHILNKIAKTFNFSDFPQYMGVTIKEKHTIVEKWPYRLKRKPHQRGAKEDFNLSMRGGASGKELYLEWKRVSV
ncbi:unnamed protein product [Fusarium graminearum]|nr:hypothetical protein FGRA07_00457 [Fusarium graminearum]CAF3612824.1 unnamed protein product [Fusarium graminearum]CAG1960141.1 unnamed protein product [Fusarium graminearum]CAG1965983.1 unnamed protein product [Fusarium graminearum]